MVSETGSGHRAGGADLASWVDTAGTVARIDLRLPHHPRLGSPLLRYVRYNRSQARAHPASAAARQPPSITRIYSSDSHHPPSPVAVRRICSGCQQRAPRADARVAMGRLPGNKSRAEARSLGDSVPLGPLAPSLSPLGAPPVPPRTTRPLPVPCTPPPRTPLP